MTADFETVIAYRRYRLAPEPHCHDYAQVIIPLSGVMEIEVNGHSEHLTTQRVGIVAAQARHAFDTTRDSEFLVLDVSNALILNQFEEVSSLYTIKANTIVQKYAFLLATATSSGRHNALARSTAAAKTALELLSDTRATGTYKIIPPHLVRVKRHLEADIKNTSPVGEVIAGLNISAAMFHRQFKSAFHKTPKQVQIEARLNYAIGRLTKSEDTITQIAQQVGYENTCSLTCVFKNHLGVTPSFYRN